MSVVRPRRVLAASAALFGVLFLAADARASGFEGRVAGFRRAGPALRVQVEVRNAIDERLRQALERGGTLYLKIEAALWERRSVWDRLVRPAAVSVARIKAESGSRSVVVVDPFGVATAYALPIGPVTVWAELVPIDRVDSARSYYVHATIVIGTIGEGEIGGVGDALFGADREAGGLSSLGKLFFEKVLSLADYLDSRSCDVKSGRLSGSELRATK